MPRNLTQQEKDLACLLIQLHTPDAHAPAFYAVRSDGYVKYHSTDGTRVDIANGFHDALSLNLMPRNSAPMDQRLYIICRDLPAAWQAHYALRQYLTGEAPPATPAPMPHTMPIEQTLLYAVLTQSKSLAPFMALEMISDARADVSLSGSIHPDREHALLYILDRTGPLIDGIFARVLSEIGPLVP